MTITQKVDATPLCQRELDLFVNAHGAWAHLLEHVFHAAESGNWGVLIPELKVVLDARQRDTLHRQARQSDPEKVPEDLQAIWTTFLTLVAAAVETGTTLDWYWEEKPQDPVDGPYRVFSPSGILAYLDEAVVRTGFLPFKGDLPPELVTENDRRYQLFCACRRKVLFKYQRARQEGRFVSAPSALTALMGKVLDQSVWEKVK